MAVQQAGLNIFAGDPMLTEDHPTTGRVFWVGSTACEGGVAGSDSGGVGNSAYKPMATIDYAVGRCTANRGDRIKILPGHAETISTVGGLDLDVAGITIEFLGEGNVRGAITFGSVVGADMDVDAADITIINPRFVAGIDALTGPIDVNSARFKMTDATWQDGTTINTTDCLVADANADDMTIDGFEFIDGDAAGTQKQSFIQVAGATRPVIKNIKCTGDFGTGNIENGTAWVDAYLENLALDNANASPTVCIALQPTSSGWIKDSSLRVASGTTYLTANNDMQFDNVKGTGTDATATEEVGTQLAGGLEAKIDVIDGYHDVPSTDGTTDAVIRDVVGAKADTTTQTIATNASLMRYVKGILNAVAGAAGLAAYPDPASPANAVNIAEVLSATYYEAVGGGGLNAASVNLISASADFGAAAWSGVEASHTVFTISGLVHARMLAYCTSGLTATAGANLMFGVSGNSSALILSTSASGLVLNDLWLTVNTSTNHAYSSMIDRLLSNRSVGYFLTGAPVTAGTIKFLAFWEPISTGSTLTAGTGTALT